MDVAARGIIDWHDELRPGGRCGKLRPTQVLPGKLDAGTGRQAQDRRWAWRGELGAGAGRGAALGGDLWRWPAAGWPEISPAVVGMRVGDVDLFFNYII
jgi:hypothetical protein